MHLYIVGLNNIKFDTLLLKGALDKYTLFIGLPNFIENFKWNQHQNFQLILPSDAFSFYEVFCEQHQLQSVP